MSWQGKITLDRASQETSTSKEQNGFMVQVSPQYCPRCGTEIVPQQKFCATCGNPQALQNVEQQAFPPSSQQPVAPMSMEGFPPPSQQPLAAPVSMGGFPLFPQQPPVQHSTIFNPVPPVGKRKLGRVGIVFLLIALLLVVIAVGYLVLQASGVGKPTQAPITRRAINTSVMYASTDLTVLNVQQSQNFLDDPHSASDGMVRLQIQARNTSSQPVTLAYNTIAHLVLANGKEIANVYASGNPTIVAGATQTSNVDFVLPAHEKADRVRFGAADEAQLDVPLNGHADMSKYAAKTIKITKELFYLNMQWMLVDASSQLNFNGQQAGKGMRYITVTFNVSNPLMETVIPGSPYVYMHLKIDTSETVPISASMPVSFDAGTSGKTGTATFQVPQGSSTLTLTLGAAGNTGFDPSTAIFQL